MTQTPPGTTPPNQDGEYVPHPAKPPWCLHLSSPTPTHGQVLLTPTLDWFGFSRIKKKKNPSVCMLGPTLSLGPVTLSVSHSVHAPDPHSFSQLNSILSVWTHGILCSCSSAGGRLLDVAPRGYVGPRSLCTTLSTQRVVMANVPGATS